MVATVPTSNPHMGMLVELAGKMSKGVKSHSYESGNDDEMTMKMRRMKCNSPEKSVVVEFVGG